MEIKVTDIEKSFGELKVLKGISFNAKSGNALGLLGRNGAGKTTTIRIVMGVFSADKGEITVDGKPIDRNKIRIGYMPEERGLYPKKVILEQLVYFGLLKGMNKKQAVGSAKHWLERLKMQEYTNRRLDSLSKGNQQKIQLAATLISNPDIIILDEPFSGLDPVNAMLLKDIVKEQIANNKIVLFSSHQMNYIEEFCSEIAIINGGEIVLAGNINEIKHSYDRRKIIIRSENCSKIKKILDEECQLIEDGLMVQLKNQEDKGALLRKLAAVNVDIDEIKVFEPSLNDIFVEYTEGQI